MRRISPAIGAFLLAGGLLAPVWAAGPAQAADCKPSGQSAPGNGNPNTGQGAPNQPGGGTNSQPAPGVPAPVPTPETPAGVLVGVLQGYLNPCPPG
jgi:hypothetical protein